MRGLRRYPARTASCSRTISKTLMRHSHLLNDQEFFCGFRVV
jgi:hypothetical protein